MPGYAVGVEALFEAVSRIFGPLKGLLNSASLSSTLALTGILILLTIGLLYTVYGLVKLGKLLWNLKVRSFLLGLTVLGATLIVLSVVLP